MILERKSELQSKKGYDIPTWEEIYSMLLNLAKKIRKDNFHFDIIVGISRGGWIPARVLSDLLENPEIANVRAEFYLGIAATRKEPVITQSVSVNVKDKSVLAVDDVVDTGKSLQLVKDYILEQGAKELRVASLYYKPWSITRPDYHEETTRDWVIFPWERKEALRSFTRKLLENGKTVEDAVQALVKCGLDKKLATRFINEFSEDQR